MNNRLYVGNLPYDVTKDELHACFAASGNVVETHLPMDRETGRARGFAFITMKTDEEAASTLQQLDGTMFGGRPLRVRIAEERRPATTNDPPSGADSNRNARGGHRGW